MIRYRVLTSAWACVVLLAGCGTIKTRTDTLDRLKRCTSNEGPLDGYCGTVEVWENRQAKTGRRIRLKVVVLPGARRADNPDPLFFLAGGPGQAATREVAQIQQAFRPVLADRDIVLVDQRGTGGSNSLACEPQEDEQLKADPEAAMHLLRGCMKRFNADLRLYTTAIAMEDLNQVRESLGYGRINLYGASYGTRAAITYVKQHPETVRSVVLDSVAPPSMILPLYFARDSQRAFDQLIAACAADAACAGAFPNLADRFQQLLARLDRKPERVTVAHPRTGKPEQVTFDRLTISGIVFTALYLPETAAMLPLLIHRATEGDYTGLLALNWAGIGAVEGLSAGMRYSVICAEDAPRLNEEMILRETAGTFAGAALVKAFVKPCEFWPRGEVPERYHAPFASDAPTLIVSGQFDPVTPPVWGEQIAKQWRNTKHVVVPGIGHGGAMRGCMMRVVRKFLNEANPAGVDASCAETLRRRPFFLSYAGPTS
ncbi:MAG TPA: alpha/beta hydrolase [Bryobacteraceae bacterium]|nr:alpha/beta hydrolase [Bryobacteraceae bacterium]